MGRNFTQTLVSHTQYLIPLYTHFVPTYLSYQDHRRHEFSTYRAVISTKPTYRSQVESL